MPGSFRNYGQVMDGPIPPADTPPDAKLAELLVEALKVAIHAPGEHRLYQSGKLPGLFTARAGPPNDAALYALRTGLLETVRTEAKGKVITEWVCATPKAVAFVHDHDSPRSILRELKDVLQVTNAAVPLFLAEARTEFATFAAKFEERASELLSRLDDMAKRCEAALRRAETSGPAVSDPVGQVIPWALPALEYLDRRRETGLATVCPLPELFRAVCVRFPGLELPAFLEGVKRLHDIRALRLVPAVEMPEPEYAVVADGKLMYAAGR
jgi:hypothetical protein